MQIKNANYGVLDELARGCVELSKIETQWDEMMRVSGSLKLGTVHASELVGSLLKKFPSVRAGAGDYGGGTGQQDAVPPQLH